VRILDSLDDVSIIDPDPPLLPFRFVIITVNELGWSGAVAIIKRVKETAIIATALAIFRGLADRTMVSACFSMVFFGLFGDFN
jgi:hypothetical protein